MGTEAPKEALSNPVVDWVKTLILQHLGTMLDSRTVAMIIPGVAVLSTPDNLPVLMTILMCFAISLLAAAFSHILRKVFFPYIDLEAFATKAKEEPMASAVVFLSVSIVLSTVLVLMMFGIMVK